ncbi:MAG: hypothetical protein KGI99_06015 [Bradyrhizobium sp.]|nr:hypothetical protein [Bradyrhizobium sp.]MBU6463025.1 hypothetical protein [Pseudomonadota bacterium]MDE2066774.1 hypothetical protein [Bradyrhizobium sp.]
MRITLALVALLYSTAVMAQASPPAAGSPPTASSPPTVGEQPLLQVKPRGHKARAVPASSKSASVAKKLQACLEIDDGTKGRLDCDDAIFPPKPNPKAKPADRVMDCRFIKEEDERLNCYNGFAEKIPKF